ncbi:MAG: dihydropyrimidinase [Ilumatobacteraceae bacterium]
MRLLVRNGTVVSPTGRVANDVLVDGETVVAVGAPGYFDALIGDVEVIDATGKYVVPGGVDVHVHMELPFGDSVSSDTFETGTRAAAWGGVTTIVDMPCQRKGERVMDTLATWHARAEGNCAVDYAFHQVIGDVTDESLAAMRHLVDHEGITSFKMFTAYPGVYYVDDGELLRALQVSGELGAIMLLHAENGPAIDVLVQQALARGATDPVQHSYTRPSALEAEAVHRAIVLSQVAGNAPMYVVHMSSGEALEEVAAARHHGRNVFAETCPQYLWHTLEETLARPGGEHFICTPPLRSAHDPQWPGTNVAGRTPHQHGHRADLWKGLRMNEVAVVATDHCPFCSADKVRGTTFASVPNGIGGVEHRMGLVYQGVVAGELTLERWVETCSTTPARMFGMYPRKGIIAPGSDADLVVFDPAGTTVLGAATHHMNIDHSAWEGFRLDGKVDTVVSRGTVVVRGDQYLGRAGHGRFVRRGLSSYLV